MGDGVKLSATQQKALDCAKAHGGALERWTGGFWTFPGAPTVADHGGYKVPAEHYGWPTIKALIDRGIFEVVGRMPRGDPNAVRLKEDD